MKIVNFYILFFMLFIQFAHGAEQQKENILLTDKKGNEIQISNCSDYNHYLFKGYRVKEHDYAIKEEYLTCSLNSVNNIHNAKMKAATGLIYDMPLDIPLPPAMRKKTPKELSLTWDKANNIISGYVDDTYMSLAVKKRISDNVFLVWASVDITTGTYKTFEVYLFNTHDKNYREFYNSFLPPII